MPPPPQPQPGDSGCRTYWFGSSYLGQLQVRVRVRPSMAARRPAHHHSPAPRGRTHGAGMRRLIGSPVAGALQTIFLPLDLIELAGFAVVVAVVLWSRIRASRGDDNAAKRLILPAYWRLFMYGALYSLAHFFVDDVFGIAQGVPNWVNIVLISALLGIRNAVIDGTTMFFMREYFGSQSMRNSFTAAIIWGTAVGGTWVAVSITEDVGGLNMFWSPERTGFSLSYCAIVIIVVVGVLVGQRIPRVRRVLHQRTCSSARPSWSLLLLPCLTNACAA